MSDDKRQRRLPRAALARRQRGAAAIEFALLAIAFFTLLFGILEVARAIYLFNTLQEVTRRAAALAVNTNFDDAGMTRVRTQALLTDNDGNLILGAPVTPDHLKIEYLSLSLASGSPTLLQASKPSCPARNFTNCLTDPYGASCIRFVRVRVCEPDGAAGCTPVPYQPLIPFLDFSMLTLPRSTTIAPAQTLGRESGALPCT